VRSALYFKESIFRKGNKLKMLKNLCFYDDFRKNRGCFQAE